MAIAQLLFMTFILLLLALLAFVFKEAETALHLAFLM